MAGRPEIYTEELGLEICRLLSNGESLRSICNREGMPAQSTIYLWLLDESKPVFSENYNRARASQAEVLFDEMLEIADNADEVVKNGAEKKSGAFAQNQKLRVDARKFYISKVLPKKFGEKLDLTSDGKEIKGNTIIFKDFNESRGQS